MPPDGTPDVLTIPEAARRLRVGRNSAYEAAQRGELPVLRIGRRLLVPRVALERLLAGNGADSRNADAAGSAGRGVHSKETTCASDDSPRPQRGKPQQSCRIVAGYAIPNELRTFEDYERRRHLDLARLDRFALVD